MVRRIQTGWKPLLVGLVTGLAPLGVIYYDGNPDPYLAFFIWASFTVVGILIVRQKSQVNRSRGWNLLNVIIVIGSAMLGVHMNLPMADDLIIELKVLTIGVGYAAMLIGVEIGRNSRELKSTPTAAAGDHTTTNND